MNVSLERGLESGDHGVLRLAVAGKGTAREGRMLVIHRDLDCPSEVPIDPESPRGGLLSAGSDRGVGGERALVQLELSVPTDQFECPEATVLEVQRFSGKRA